jgi:hypothetical protein
LAKGLPPFKYAPSIFHRREQKAFTPVVSRFLPADHLPKENISTDWKEKIFSELIIQRPAS